jgi:electron transfer flavoprotein beta subunit
MKILVLLKMVPDVVEELEVAADGKSLDIEFLRLIVNESDDHALEEALILKERHGGTVAAVALAAPDIDDVLFTALAKGADRAVKIEGAAENLSTRRAAGVLAETLPAIGDLLPVDLILTGCQAIDDVDGFVAPSLAQALGLPYAGLVSQVTLEDGKAVVAKEFAGGVRGEYEIPLPAVLGVQGAEKPPRYVPVAKVRAAMKSAEIETIPAGAEPDTPSLEIEEMLKPEPADRAEMIEGDPEAVAARICEILSERGLL